MTTTLIKKDSAYNMENIYAAIEIIESGVLDKDKTRRNNNQTIKFLASATRYLLDKLFIDGKIAHIIDDGIAFKIEYEKEYRIQDEELLCEVKHDSWQENDSWA